MNNAWRQGMRMLLGLALCFFGVAQVWAAAHITHHSLQLELDLGKHQLQGRDRMTVAGVDGPFHILIGKAFEISAIRVGKATTFAKYLPATPALFGERDDPRDADFWASVWAVPLVLSPGQTESEIEIEWSGTAFDTAGLAGFSHDAVGPEVNAYLGEEGVYLSPEGVYYPRIPKDLAAFRTEVVLPGEYRVVTSGRSLLDEVTEGTRRVIYDEPNPIDGLTISAGKWERHSRRHGNVLIETYFYAEDTSLVPVYLNSLERALDIYEPRIAPYPFTKFAVVENFFETGYGLPGFTLLGRSVVKLPFIPHTSLPHELLHNWWGNSVYVDDTLGNWCEGITVYLSDYMYKEMVSDSAARDYRWTILRDYTAYVGPGEGIALSEFRERTNRALRAVGYGKCMMVFHALHRMLGEEAFAKALRRFYANHQFQHASWADIEHEFEMASGLDLKHFFDEWIMRSDAPKLSFGQIHATKEPDQYRLEVEVLQPTDPPYELEVPLKVYCEDGVAAEQPVRISTGRLLTTVYTKARPLSVALDPDAHGLRVLWPEEQPATIAAVIGAPKRVFILPENGEEALATAEKQLLERLMAQWGGELVDGAAWREAPQEAAIVIPWRFGELKGTGWGDLAKVVAASSGNPTQVRALLERVEPSLDPTVVAGRGSSGRLFLLINSADPEALTALARKLPHYGKYSYLGFRSGQNVVKGVWEPTSPRTVEKVSVP
jgi:aminopeptidase N